MIDPQSRTWLSIARHARHEIERAQQRLEMPRADPLATEFDRGRIRALRDVLALADAAPADTVRQDVHYAD